jgi:Carboxypeptidase regulatory-like domain
MRAWLVLITMMVLVGISAVESVAQPTAPGAAFRITVLDQTGARLVTAQVTLVDAAGIERTVTVNASGVAAFEGLTPGTYQVRATAEGFGTIRVTFVVKRGENQTTMRLAIAGVQQTVNVQGESPSQRRDNGFTQTLSADEIDALSDDPDEMADQLAELAGPGAQIYVDGFRGGRLPPKAQIQQIRFHSNSYSAEYHDAGMVRVEVITRPGMTALRGQVNIGFGPGALDAKNAFALEKGDQRLNRYAINIQAPLVKGKTSLSIAADGNASYTSRTIVAASPTGDVFGQVRQPTDGLNTSIRIVHQISENHQLRAEYARRSNSRDNLGVGDFDLPSRAFAIEGGADTLRVLNTRLVGKVFSELKVEWSTQHNDTTSTSSLPAIRVLDAFTSGGAGQSGARVVKQFQIEQNVDVAFGKRHTVRAGLALESGWWDSTNRSNSNGTYTFSNLADYNAGRPSIYTRRIGDPVVAYSMLQVGWYLQDDVRLSKSFSVGLGVRQEAQTQVNDKWNLAPRAAFTWNVDRTTVVRGGYGLFYDWFDSNLYEQTLRVDGTHQVDLVVTNPGFPAVEGRGVSLPPSVIRSALLTQPLVQQASAGVERPITPWMGLHVDYMWTRASDALRSINVNAPVSGVRPSPVLGNVTEIQSTGRRASDRLSVSLNLRSPKQRVTSNVSYQLQSARNYADSATSLPSNSNDPDADWGPSAQDVRHRLVFTFNAPLPFGTRVGVNLQASSATPYTITTGRDENGDTVFNDRPAGVGRNSERGAAQFNGTVRVTKSLAIGGAAGGVPGRPGATPSGGDASSIGSADGGRSAGRRMDVYAQVSNPFNYVNDNAFVGTQLSPFFGQATSAGPARRVELGLSLSF